MDAIIANTMMILAGSHIDENIAILENPEENFGGYTTTQIVGGLIFDIIFTSLMILWLVRVWYINFGPGAKKREAAAAGS